MPAAIAFEDVSLSLPQGRMLLDGVSLSLEAGTVTALLGRSGSGKTTLLRMVNRMARPTSGAVRVQGTDVLQQDVIALRRGIGYVIQETGLFPHWNIERNVQIVPEVQGAARPARTARAHELLARVGLPPGSFARRHPSELSGGQRQRVGLARALAADPAILLMDEPFGALDPLTRGEMQDLLRTLLAPPQQAHAQQTHPQKTVLLVTHDLDEALYLADRVVLLDEGRIAADLPAAQFLASPLPEVQAYVRAFHRGAREAQP
ncbi:MAG TPA: ABC transporter ATP-binding protein [Acidobacterium sp.]|uniref:Amine ABC transporter, quaternary amine uptake transporter (QAT) family, ATP-binding protein n=2 Tax=Acidobacteriaceae TaxID=204434 RepID=C1F1M6_ACIC5|nr:MULTISPECIES: ATP-binding cassette domain-containing protein [Acidobacterium]ACO33411.1 amine ABC transporter, quaternary amine uptake transporter (QAT) family, ATP-binding protein [Acidobacterium capsulatum ATCC 51196]HCT61353.1 ABC transporter ATP-binding protein [Acidobacterium sp.]